MEYKINAHECLIAVYDIENVESQTILLLLHGGPGSGAAPLMELSTFHTLEKQYHCIYFDQRGSGKSTYNLAQGLNKLQLCEDVHTVVNDIKHRYPNKEIVLWGGSFGGLLACMYVETYQVIDKLILSSPAITFHRDEAIALFTRNRKMMENRLHKQEMAKTNDVEPEQILGDKAFSQFVFSTQNPSNSLRHIVAMSSWFYKYSALNCLKNITIPTLIIIGQEDPICDATILSRQLTKINNTCIQFEKIENCGHTIFTDQEVMFISIMSTFIKDK